MSRAKKTFTPTDTSGIENLLTGVGSRFGTDTPTPAPVTPLQVSSERHDGTTAERHDGEAPSASSTAAAANPVPAVALPAVPRPAPAAPAPARPGARGTNKYTVLLSDDDAAGFDDLALTLRRACGRRVDKSEILRIVLRMVAQRPELADQVAEHLNSNGMTV